MNTNESKENIFQRKIGKVYDYDEITGRIISDDKNYEFSYMGLDELINNGDIVSFTINNDIAGDIRKYKTKFLIK